MSFIAVPANDADMPRLFEITSLAFKDNEPFWDAMYPRHNTNLNPMMDGGGVSMDNNGNNFNGGFSAMANSNSGYWGDPSSAWFMPFNMDPPTMADDSNLLNTGGFDWPNVFADFGGLAPTGLTPTPVTMDMGDDGQGGMDTMG